MVDRTVVIAIILAILTFTAPMTGVVGAGGLQAGGTVEASSDEIDDDELVSVSDDVDVWDRSVLTLRTLGDTGVAVEVENLDLHLQDADGESTSADRNHIRMYDVGSAVRIDFSSANVDTSPLANDDAQILVGYVDEDVEDDDVNLSDVPTSIDEFREQFTGDNVDNLNRNVSFELIDTESFDGNGELQYDYTPDESGLYMATVTTGDGLSVDDGNVSIVDQTTVVGSISFAAQDDTTNVDAPESAIPGETIDFDVEATALSGEVNHTVVVYNEEDFVDSQMVVNATEEFDNLSTENITIEHEIAALNGVSNLSDDVSLFGQDIDERSFTGTLELVDIVSFLANESDFDKPDMELIGEGITLDSSTTSVRGGVAETVPVETRANWSTGEYRYVHLATGPSTSDIQANSDTIDIVHSQDAFFDVEILDVPDSVEAGDDAEVLVRVENLGLDLGTQDIEFEIDNETRTVEENLSLDAGEPDTFVASVPTEAADSEDSPIELTVSSDDTTETTTIDVEAPAEFDVDLDLNEPELVAGENITGTASVENVGDSEGTQTVTVTVDDDEFISTEISLDNGSDETFNIDYETDLDHVGDVEVVVESEDDDDSETITVLQPPTYDLTVIEDESRLDVVEGQDAFIVVEVENVGDVNGTDEEITVNWTDSGSVTTETVTLDAGDRDDIISTYTTSSPGEYPVDITSPNASENISTTFTVNEADDAYFEVTIDETSAANESEDVWVNGTVENIGQETDTQTIEFLLDDDVNHTETIALNGTLDNGEYWEFNETLPTETGDAPNVDVAVRSENETATETVDLLALPEFTVSIINVDDDIIADENFTATIAVQNVGDHEADGNLTLEFNRSVANQTTEDVKGIGPGEIKQIDLIVPNTSTVGEEGERLLSAAIGVNATDEIDDTSRTRVTVGDAANFEVDRIDLNVTEVGAGMTVEVTGEIKNTGDTNDTQLIEFELDGETFYSQDVELEHITKANTTEITEIVETGSDNIGEANVSVSTGDDQNETTLTVNERANFEITDVDYDVDAPTDQLVRGEEVTVTVEVENTGGWMGEDSVRFYVDSSRIESSNDFVLSDGEVTTKNFTYTPETTDETEILVFTDDDAVVEEQTVLEPADIELEIRSMTDPVTAGENLTVNLRATNHGETPAEDETFYLVIDGVEDRETISIDGESAERFNLTTELDSDADLGELDVEVVGVDDASDRTEVIEPPTEADFRVSNLDANDSAIQFDDKNVTVSADVTNIGNLTGSQDIVFSVAGDEVDTESDVELDGGNETSVEFNLSVDEYDPGNVTYEIASDNRTVSDTIELLEPQDGELELVDVDIDDAVTQEGTLEATVTVENIGDLAVNDTVEFTYEPGDAVGTQVIDSVDVTELDAGHTTTVELSIEPPAEPHAGSADRDVMVTVAEETETDEVSVDFEGVRSGVEAAADLGVDVVTIEPGTYDHRSTIAIDQAGLTLEAADPTDEPVIEIPYGNDDTAIDVQADDVRIAGIEFVGDGNGTALSVEGTDVELVEVTVQNWETGIETTDGTGIEIRRASIEETETGILLEGDGNGEIAHTSVTDSETGIYLASDGNLVRVTTVQNTEQGIEITGEDNRVERSFVRDNEVGVNPVVPAAAVGDDDFFIVTESNLERNEVSVDIGLNGTPTSPAPDADEINAVSNWWGTAGGATPGVDFLEVNPSINVSDPFEQRNVPGEFVFDSEVIPNEVVRNDDLVVEATIENIGGTEGEPLVVLSEDGEVLEDDDGHVFEELGEIDPGETETVTLTYETSVTDEPAIDLRLETEDDRVDQTVDVLQPAFFDVSILSVDDPVEEGDDLDVEVEVENTGEAEVTQSIRFEIDNDQRTTESVELGEDDMWVDTVSVPTQSGDHPSAQLRVSSDDDDETRTVTIDEADEPDPDTEPPTRINPEYLPVPDPIVEPPADVVVDREETLRIDVDVETGMSGIISVNTSVREIVFETTDIDGEITLRDIDRTPEETGDPPGLTTAVSQIAVPDDVASESATIRTAIDATVIADADVDSADLVVHRHADGEWQGLDTSIVEETDEEVIVEAETPGFSFFAVSAVSEPDAQLSVEPDPATPDEEILLDGSDSSDRYGEIEDYEWTVDGEVLSGETTTVEFTEPGEYVISLTVTNDAGESDTAETTITVEAPPDDDVDDEDDDEVVIDDDDEPIEEPALFGLTELIALLVVLVVLVTSLWYVRNRDIENLSERLRR